MSFSHIVLFHILLLTSHMRHTNWSLVLMVRCSPHIHTSDVCRLLRVLYPHQWRRVWR